MKNLILLFPLCLILSCTKSTNTIEETLTPTNTEKKIIDAATSFFKSNGDYYQIVNNYVVALRPMLTVRRALTEGACTSNVFQMECCCPWNFLLSPYDVVNGNNTGYNYPKSALFTARPGKMEGSISAAFVNRPVSSDRTELQYNNLSFAGTSINLNGAVSVKDVIVSSISHNVMCTAEFSDNSIAIASGQISSISGNLSFTNGDAGGKLDITYSDNRKISAEITVTDMPPNVDAAFVKKASFTTESITAQIDCWDKQTITIGTRTFKLSL